MTVCVHVPGTCTVQSVLVVSGGCFPPLILALTTPATPENYDSRMVTYGPGKRMVTHGPCLQRMDPSLVYLEIFFIYKLSHTISIYFQYSGNKKQ